MSADLTREQVLHEARAVFRTAQAALAWYTLPSPRLGDSPQALVERGEAARVLGLLAELQRAAPAPPLRIFGLPAAGRGKVR